MMIEDYLHQMKPYLLFFGVKPYSMKEKNWVLLDRQMLHMIRLMLACNIAFNIVNEKTTTSLMKALSNMYEKPLTPNKVSLIR